MGYRRSGAVKMREWIEKNILGITPKQKHLCNVHGAVIPVWLRGEKDIPMCPKCIKDSSREQ